MKPSHRHAYRTAALLWIIAGGNVLRLGVLSWLRYEGSLVAPLLWLTASFAFFALFIFPRVSRRNLDYVAGLEAPYLWQCFSPRSWLIMAFMIALGVSIRSLGLAPDSFIAGFYCGLGSALLLAALPYLRKGWQRG